MSCQCQNITKIRRYVAPADTGIDLGLTAPAAGDYTVLLEFNGTYQQLVLTMANGGEFILPNIVNGEYDHELQILKPDGTLLNATCYNLSVRTITGNGNGLTPSPTSKDWIIITVSENSATLTDTWLTSHTATKIFANGQAYFSPVDFTQAGDIITGINISFSIDQIIRIEA